MDMIGIIKRVIINYSTSIFSNYSILNNILYDYAKSDYTNQRLVELFLQLIKNDNAYNFALNSKECDINAFLKNKHNIYNKFTEEEFEQIKDVLIFLVDPNQKIKAKNIILINSKNSLITIKKSVDDEIKVYLNKVKKKLSKNEYKVVNGDTTLNLNYVNERIELHLPSRHYQKIDIRTTNSNVNILEDIDIDQLIVNSTNGNLNICSSANFVKGITTNGIIKYKGKINELILNTTNDDIELIAEDVNKINCSINCNTVNGEVIIDGNEKVKKILSNEIKKQQINKMTSSKFVNLLYNK